MEKYWIGSWLIINWTDESTKKIIIERTSADNPKGHCRFLNIMRKSYDAVDDK